MFYLLIRQADNFVHVSNLLANPLSNPYLFIIRNKENDAEEHVFAAETKFELNASYINFFLFTEN